MKILIWSAAFFSLVYTWRSIHWVGPKNCEGEFTLSACGQVTSKRLDSLQKRKADFIEAMGCAPVSKLRDGQGWVYEIKLDGYRAIAVKSGRVNLFSRRHKSSNHQYRQLVEALSELPEGTVVDGEAVSWDDAGPCRVSHLS